MSIPVREKFKLPEIQLVSVVIVIDDASKNKQTEVHLEYSGRHMRAELPATNQHNAEHIHPKEKIDIDVAG